MNRKKRNWIIISIALALGLCAVVVLVQQKRPTTLKQVYHIEDIQSVTKIFMANKVDEQTLLERKDGDTVWTVDGKYPTNPPLITMLLETLRDMRIFYPVANSAKANMIKNLATVSTKVEIYQKVYRINLFGKIKLFPHEKLTKTIFVGRETQDNQGTVMFLKGTETPCVINIPGFRGFVAPRFSADPKIWRSHTIFDADVHKIESIKVEVPQMPSESFKIVRNENSFDVVLLANNERLSAFDTNKVGILLTSFVNASFEGFATGIPKIEVDTIFGKGPAFIVTLTETSGKSRWLKAYPKLMNPDTHVMPFDKDNFYEILDVDRMYGLVEGIQDTVYLQYYIFDNILCPASALRYKGQNPN